MKLAIGHDSSRESGSRRSQFPMREIGDTNLDVETSDSSKDRLSTCGTCSHLRFGLTRPLFFPIW